MILLRPAFIQLFQAVSTQVIHIGGFLPLVCLAYQTVHPVIDVRNLVFCGFSLSADPVSRLQGPVAVQVMGIVEVCQYLTVCTFHVQVYQVAVRIVFISGTDSVAVSDLL